jgi:phage tail protein X
VRALVLVSTLALLVAGAYLFQQVRFGSSTKAAPRLALPGDAGDVVLEIGGGPPGQLRPSPRPPVGSPPPRDAREGLAKEADASPGMSDDPRDASEGPPGRPRSATDSRPASVVRLRKGETLYSLARKHYGSGADPVLRDLAKANGIASVAKVREGTAISLPETAGGRSRR